MTGPEHYLEAERLLTEAAVEGGEGTYFVRPENLTAAQVHATLAHAAATALISPSNSAAESNAWREVAGTSTTGIEGMIR
jgi:hypothetical protein